MRIKRTLLDDVEEVYFSIPCMSACECTYCKNEEFCTSLIYVLKSLKNFY